MRERVAGAVLFDFLANSLDLIVECAYSNAERLGHLAAHAVVFAMILSGQRRY
jgi:hypothetical protein